MFHPLPCLAAGLLSSLLDDTLSRALEEKSKGLKSAIGRYCSIQKKIEFLGGLPESRDGMGIFKQVDLLRCTCEEGAWSTERRWAKMWAGMESSLTLIPQRALEHEWHLSCFTWRQEGWASVPLCLSVTGRTALYAQMPLGILWCGRFYQVRALFL